MTSALIKSGDLGVSSTGNVKQQVAVSNRHFDLSKRCFDVVFSFIGIVLLAPLLVAIAALIKAESDGPVFFCQMRNGLGCRPFKIYKFRSMHVYSATSEFLQAKRGDARITAVGRFLRSSSLDELPQLFNVLKGEMSLVGPRPHAIAHDVSILSAYPGAAARFSAKPGITGLAQISGARGETPTLWHVRRRVRMDIVYVRSRTISLDLRIVFGTLRSLIRHRGVF